MILNLSGITLCHIVLLLVTVSRWAWLMQFTDLFKLREDAS